MTTPTTQPTPEVKPVAVKRLTVAQPSKPTPVKAVLFGVEGVGKSSLAAKFPAPLFIDVEGSTERLVPQPAKLPKTETFDEVRTQLAMVLNEGHEYKTLVIDTIDWLEKRIEKYVCIQNGKQSIADFDWGKGFNLIEDHFSKLLQTLDAIRLKRDMHILLIGHSIVRTVYEPDKQQGYDRFEINLSKKTSPLVKQWSDAMLFANYKVVVAEGKNGTIAVGGKERVLTCNHSAAIDAKNRFGLPDTVPMTIEAISTIIK